jgi:hypothetical protein
LAGIHGRLLAVLGVVIIPPSNPHTAVEPATPSDPQQGMLLAGLWTLLSVALAWEEGTVAAVGRRHTLCCTPTPPLLRQGFVAAPSQL